MKKYRQKEFAEYVRLSLLSNILSVEEVHEKLYLLIRGEEDTDSNLIEAVTSNEKDIILSSLEQVEGEYRSHLVECLIASDLLSKISNGVLSPEKISFALYQQLWDENTYCWKDNLNQIMRMDDGYSLANQGIGDKQKITHELLHFLKEKKSYCSEDEIVF